MTDHARTPAPPQSLPAFTPVPRKSPRHDGWTPERQRRFIEHLADLGSVRAAANAVGMTPESAYVLRRHPEAAEFRAAWQAALALGVEQLEDIAMDRALHGVEVPVYSYGKLVGTRRAYNDALLMFLLRNRAAHRFNADNLASNDVATRAQLERLKREWRAEWEAEDRARRHAESEHVLARINAKLELMRQRTLEHASFTSEELEAAAQAAEDAADQAEREKQAAANGTPYGQPGPLHRPSRPRPPRLPHPDAEPEEAWLVHVEEGRIGARANLPPRAPSSPRT